MKRMQALQVGQVVGLGFGVILIIASLVALLGRVAYVISASQRDAIQTRSEVERLTLRLELVSIRRTDALNQYLRSRDVTLLAVYQTHQAAYNDTFSHLARLMRTADERQALQGVIAGERALVEKAQEVMRLNNQGFDASALFLWTSEGAAAQDSLLQAIDELRQVQGNTSKAIIDEARRTEALAIRIISIFIPLLLIGGIAAGFLISRAITRPISQLVTAVNEIGADLSTRVTPSGPQEIAFLGETINTMAANLFSSRQTVQLHKERLERELTLAGRIQTSLIPSVLPDIPGLEIATFRQSARELGGDFFTFIRLKDGRSGLALGDASGKGAPAAMASALAVGLLEAQAPAYSSLERLLAALNDELHLRFSADSMNIACCCVVLEQTSGCLSVVNAGCVYPYLRRPHDLHEINAYGMPLGMWPDFNYLAQSCRLHAGDLLLLSSDGFVEAKNERNELFGFDRLEEALSNLPPGVTAQAAIDQLVATVMNFTGQAELQDDLTLVVARGVAPLPRPAN